MILDSSSFKAFVTNFISGLTSDDGIRLEVEMDEIISFYDIWRHIAESSVSVLDNQAVRHGVIINKHRLMNVVGEQLGMLCMLLSGGKSTVRLLQIEPSASLTSLQRRILKRCPQQCFAMLVCAGLYRNYALALLDMKIEISDDVIGRLFAMCDASFKAKRPSIMKTFPSILIRVDDENIY